MAYIASRKKLLVCGFAVLFNIFIVLYIQYRTIPASRILNKQSISVHDGSYSCCSRKAKEQRYTIFSEKIVNISRDLNHKGVSFNIKNQGNESGQIIKIIRIMNAKYTKIFQTSAADKVLGTKKVDIQNDYYPFVDFKFVYPEISPEINRTQKYFMLVLVNSGAKGQDYRKRRDAVRQTWGDRNNCEQRKALRDEKLKDLRWLLVFVVGKVGPGTNDDKLNMAEARQHNDMLIGNITDNYINNVVKFYMGQIWASGFDIKYTMKTDDDVYVRIPGVLEYLVKAKFPRPFYGGMTYPSIRVNREISGKWTVSWKYYEETHFPRFNPGAFFILSSDLLSKLFKYVYIRKPFHTDDAYIGVAIRDFKVNTTRLDSFRVGPRMPQFIRTVKDCEMLGYNAFGDSVDPQSARELHRRLQSHLCNNVTFIKC